MEIEELRDAEEAARRCAAVLAAEIEAGARHVALTGGSSPVRAYELLGPLVADWSAVHLWYGDERCVAPDDDESNHRQAQATLQAPGATWHRIQGELGPEEGAAAYEAELDGTVLDVTLLGLGPDAHIASLMPGLEGIDVTEGVAIGVWDSPKPPPERISLTLPKLNQSGRIVLLVTGESKADALSHVLAEPDHRFPGSMLDRSKLLVLTDAAAMGDR